MKSYRKGSFWVLLLIVCTLSFSPLFAADSSGVKKMKSKISSLISKNGSASTKVKTFAKNVLLPNINHPTFSAAVSEQNARAVSLNEIKKIDNEWKKAEDFLPIHDKKLENPCAEVIRGMAKQNPAIVEAFVTDDQGANVCQNELTGDYWQGDEAKWKNSFNGGKGGIDVGVEKLDKSTNAVLQQVSLPIVSANGAVIGAITFGLKIGNL